MFYGQWDYLIDSKWRLRIRKEIADQLEDKVLVFENENGYVRIENLPSKLDENHFPYVCKLSKGQSRGDRRLLIPPRLRNSTSFIFGRRVTLAGMGDRLEIWPRK